MVVSAGQPVQLKRRQIVSDFLTVRQVSQRWWLVTRRSHRRAFEGKEGCATRMPERARLVITRPDLNAQIIGAGSEFLSDQYQ